MPCTDWDMTPPRVEGGSSYASLTAQVSEQRSKIDTLTDLLCSLFRHIEDSDFHMDTLSKSHAEWWKQHKVADAKRRKAEEKAKRLKALKESALSKLTKEEKSALGL